MKEAGQQPVQTVCTNSESRHQVAARQTIAARARRPAVQAFTLLEVLVALVIIGTALSASLRSVASLTQNSQDLRAAMMATWSAENRLTQIRLSQEWPPLGRRTFACAQAELPLRCDELINPTPNPAFRRVEVSVVDERQPARKIITLSQIVPNAV